MDEEIAGMFQVGKILDDLDQEARARLLRWAADKYEVDLGQPPAEGDVEAADESMPGGAARSELVADHPRGAVPGAPQTSAESASSPAAEEQPPERDPDRPSFLDTSFRMYSGKQQLKKERGEK